LILIETISDGLNCSSHARASPSPSNVSVVALLSCSPSLLPMTMTELRTWDVSYETSTALKLPDASVMLSGAGVAVGAVKYTLFSQSTNQMYPVSFWSFSKHLRSEMWSNVIESMVGPVSIFAVVKPYEPSR
jgi:hypothetical protein